MSKRRWGRGNNQTQAHSEMSGVLRWTPSKDYGDYARHHATETPLDRAFRAARVSAACGKRPITLASVPLRDLVDK